MKKLSSLFLLLASSFVIQAQTTITSKNFSTVAKFQNVTSNKEEKYNLALAKNSSTGTYALLVEHTISDFSKNLMDTAGLSIKLEVYKEIKRGAKTWAETDMVSLLPTATQPTTNSKGRVYAFNLPDILLNDIKNQKIWQFTLVNENPKSEYHAVSEKQIGFTDQGKNFFLTNSALLVPKSKQGSFADMTAYKTKLIPLYSLFRKDISTVDKVLGKPIETNTQNNFFKNTYVTAEGKYVIRFKENLTDEIELFPTKKFKYIGPLFLIDKFPFELTNCNCGEYTSKETSGSGKYISDGLINTFRDKTQHKIEFSKKDRYLEKVIVRIY